MNYDIDPIVVYTPYTFGQMKRFHFIQMRILRFYFAILMVLMIAVFGISLANESFSGGAALELIERFATPLAILVVLGPMSFVLYYTKKRHKTATLHIKDGQTYTFHGQSFDVETHGEQASGKFTYHYDVLYRILETNDMFYLYTNKFTACLVDKQGFRSGSPESLRRLLLENVPAKKYKFRK